MHYVAEPFEAHPSAVAREKKLAQLGDEITELSAHIQAATYRLLVLIRKFEELNGWEEGFSSCARCLSWRVGLAPGAAREKVRVAQALAELPLISEAMRRGELSYSKVRALTRVATPENEERLVRFARAGTAHHVERVVRAWRGIDARKELLQENARHGKRYFKMYTDEDGMVVIRGRLTPEVAVVLRALEAAQAKLYQEQEQEQEEDVPAGTPGVEQKRADALALVAEAALEQGLDPKTRGDRYQVVVHVDEPVLADSHQPGQSVLGTDPRSRGNVSADRLRRQSGRHAPRRGWLRPRCWPQDPHRAPAMRRALEYRDIHCRFPGCGSKYCDAHHIRHWAHGGETKLDNLLCSTPPGGSRGRLSNRADAIQRTGVLLTE